MFIALFLTLVFGGLLVFLFSWFTKKPKPEPTTEDKVESTLKSHEHEISGSERKLSEIMSKRESLEQEIELSRCEAAKWESLLATALASKKESDVRACVRGGLEAKLALSKIVEEDDRLSKIIDGLQEQLGMARTKIKDARSVKTTLGARLEAAKIREKLADNNVDLEALENEAVSQEARADAFEETSQFQEDFLKKNVVANQDVEDEVQRLLNLGSSNSK